jgi:MSHA biogenesis protein MshK
MACALAQADARAQAMHDPMRPANATAGAAGGAAAPSAPALQAVLTSPGRKLAIIDGAVVPLGSAVRGSTLSGVSDSLAVLQKNGARDVLLMHPDIEKKPSRRDGQ